PADTAVLNEMMRIKFASKAAADAYAAQKRREIYMHLRAGAASGWDFSSRWFADGQSIHTIETANIVPVDLNCLILKLEQTLAKAYAGQRNTAKTRQYQTWAKERQQAIQKYFYNKATGYYYDYHFVQRRQLMAVTAAGLFPFFIMDAKQMSPLAAKAATVVRSQLLAPGGLLTTPVNSHQQWDAPNGWAPLQWVAVAGLSRCGQQALADTIAQRWITVTEGVYARTGKLMEKYNVVNTSLEAGGGEYPGQDGFGWTNGVYLALKARRW
ncbi:MAG TPA: trehalase family glycosidase, partial [Phnomibacter sp.]|nr:trehalase family glycosidase [Phnomibacter sp.]